MNGLQSNEHNKICTVYGGASICVRINPGQSVSLHINGVTRESADLTNTIPQTIRLSSTVQTDYEWHEYIVAIVEVGLGFTRVNILANSRSIVSKEIKP